MKPKEFTKKIVRSGNSGHIILPKSTIGWVAKVVVFYPEDDAKIVAKELEK